MRVEWREIVGYPGYEISNMGDVRGIWRVIDRPGSSTMRKQARTISRTLTSRGWRVRISRRGTAKNFYVHRLVAEHFVENLHDFPRVRFVNGQRDDPRAINLEWCSVADSLRRPMAQDKH
jgi:hypothetical protein